MVSSSIILLTKCLSSKLFFFFKHVLLIDHRGSANQRSAHTLLALTYSISHSISLSLCVFGSSDLNENNEKINRICRSSQAQGSRIRITKKIPTSHQQNPRPQNEHKIEIRYTLTTKFGQLYPVRVLTIQLNICKYAYICACTCVRVCVFKTIE